MAKLNPARPAQSADERHTCRSEPLKVHSPQEQKLEKSQITRQPEEGHEDEDREGKIEDAPANGAVLMGESKPLEGRVRCRCNGERQDHHTPAIAT